MLPVRDVRLDDRAIVRENARRAARGTTAAPRGAWRASLPARSSAARRSSRGDRDSRPRDRRRDAPRRGNRSGRHVAQAALLVGELLRSRHRPTEICQKKGTVPYVYRTLHQTMMPSAMRYHANGVRSWVATKRRSHRIDAHATTNETSVATMSQVRSPGTSACAVLAEAVDASRDPSVGIARKNENSVAAFRSRPHSSPPENRRRGARETGPQRHALGEADRAPRASGPPRSRRSIAGAGFHRFSTARIAIAPAMSAAATVRGPNRCSLIQWCVEQPDDAPPARTRRRRSSRTTAPPGPAKAARDRQELGAVLHDDGERPRRAG